jgi:hypothetical protein
MKLTEKQIEDVFEKFYKELISTDLTLKGRQVKIQNLRADLHFVDKNGRNVIVELKREPVTREDIGQLIQYAGIVKNSKVMLIAPIIPTSIKIAFEHYGIDYREFSLSKIEELYDKVKLIGEQTQIPKSILPINKADYITIPDKLHDGNISFKVSYNDKNWSGICSPDIYQYNSFSSHKMFWCNLQAPKCQEYHNSKLSENCYPCYDSVANLTTRFTPGWNHGKDTPHICLEAKVGKIALLTSLYPGDPQDSRFIFSIFEIERIEKIEQDDYDFKGTEFYIGNPKTAIKLKKEQYLNYWDFASNNTTNSKFQKFWGSGLFRYLDDKTIQSVLKAIIKSTKLTALQKTNAEFLLSRVE